jgi:large subunit ribosomal protein L6
MSRVGRKPVALPKGVTVAVKDGAVNVKGPKGELKRSIPLGVSLKTSAAELLFERADDSRENRAKHGMLRALVANMVRGVSEGFERKLEINGVGYRADVKGNLINLTLGYSHPIVYQLPPEVTAKVERQVLMTLESADRQLLGSVAAEIRGLRPPEPYKGKGIKYQTETIRRKAGKAAAGSSSG